MSVLLCNKKNSATIIQIPWVWHEKLSATSDYSEGLSTLDCMLV